MNKIIRSHAAMEEILDSTSPFLNDTNLIQNKVTQLYQELVTKNIDFYIGKTSSYKITIDGHLKYDEYSLRKCVDTIKKVACISPFGKGTETVIDTSVRNALELNSSQIECKNLTLKLSKELKQIAPHNKVLVPVFYKLHIYEPGGHFDFHRDTLHGDNHYATLVYTLSSDYSGGEFVLESNQKEHEFNLRTTEFIVFSTDLKHKIKPVTSGNRIVLQFDVYINDAEEDAEEDTEEEEEEKGGYYTRESNILQKKEKPDIQNIVHAIQDYMKDNKTSSFLLSHKYHKMIEPKYLKDSDKLLYDALEKLFNINLGFVINRYYIYDDNVPLDSDTKKLVVVSYNQVDRLLDHVENGKKYKKDSTIIDLFISDTSYFNEMKYEPFLEYTGNESQPALYVYSSICLNISNKTTCKSHIVY
jgi:hypothetical protein